MQDDLYSKIQEAIRQGKVRLDEPTKFIPQQEKQFEEQGFPFDPGFNLFLTGGKNQGVTSGYAKAARRWNIDKDKNIEGHIGAAGYTGPHGSGIFPEIGVKYRQQFEHGGPVNPIKSPLEMLYESAGIPHMADGSQVQAYRADPRRRFGGKEGLETQPTSFDAAQMQEYIKAMRAGRFHNVPQLTPEQLATLALVEGRSDFGADIHPGNVNQKSMQIAELLQQSGHSPKAAMFAAIVKDKMDAAKRLNVPVARAWNGLGRSSETGMTGRDYAKRFNQFMPAVAHPKNKPLMQTINEAYHYQTPEPLQLGGLEYANPMGDYSPLGQ